MKKTKHYSQFGEVTFYARSQKTMRLYLKNRQVYVSYPQTLPFKQAEDFLLSRRDWVLQRQPTPYVLKDGSRIGHRHSLSYRAGLDKPLIVDRVIYVPKDQPQVWEAGIKEALKREAEADILPLLQTTSQRLGLSYGKVTFRYMSSRWGSCNSKGNLSLNTALVYLPQRLVEYVLVHELCHLKYLDHSPLFWRLVEQHLPRTPALRGELKQYLINLVIESPNHQQPR